MKRQSVSFTKTQLQALTTEARAEGSSLADVVRRIVDAWIKETYRNDPGRADN